MFKKILCPIDFSENSAAAYLWAEQMAQRFHSQVIFTHILPYLKAGIAAREDVNSYLARGLDCLREFVSNSKSKHREVISLGDPHREIVHMAKTLKVTGIIMGTRGVTGTNHMLLGSTTENVMRESPAPVMTITSLCDRPVENHTLRILIPVSSLEQPFSVRGLRKIIHAIDSPVSLLHVADVKDFAFDFNFRGNPFRVLEMETEERRQQLAQIGTNLSTTLTRVEIRPVVRYGNVADEILTEIETGQYNFVLMRVKKGTLLSRFRDSVAYHLISHSKIPVITVRTDG